MDDLDHLALLRLEIDTLWDVDDRGRLLRFPAPLGRPAPRVVVAASAMGSVWSVAASVDPALAEEVALLLDPRERASVPEPGWAPRGGDGIVQLFAAVGVDVTVATGPSYVVAGPVAPRPTVTTWSSADHGLDALVGRMPEDERRSLRAPWAVAVADDLVVAVCETARTTPRSVEAGVWTSEAHRGRGFATAATARWTTLVEDRVAFYSTSDDNLASQRVARSLGLVPLGCWWQLLPV